MRIFMLTPYLPYPLVSGGQVRTYNLLKHLSRQHEVTLFSLIKDEEERQHIDELKKYCSHIQVFRRTSNPWHPRNILMAGVSPYPFVVTRNMVLSLKKAIAHELARQNYDLIHVETFYMMPNIPQTSLPIILVEQTIEYLGYESFAKTITRRFPLAHPLLAIDIAKIKYWEKHYWRSCSALITVSDDDRKFIYSTEPEVKTIDVVSNGVDMEYFSKMPEKPDKKPVVLFVGTFNWLPNVEAVEFLAERVWPKIRECIPEATLRIVGSSPTKKILSYSQRDTSIVVTGRVPDIRDEYARANVLVAPVFSGKGTRYKVLEAMATRTPVVGTAIALEGIGAQNGKEYLRADTADELAAETCRLLGNPELQETLGEAGQTFVANNYSWDQISRRLLHVYERTAA